MVRSNLFESRRGVDDDLGLSREQEVLKAGLKASITACLEIRESFHIYMVRICA